MLPVLSLETVIYFVQSCIIIIIIFFNLQKTLFFLFIVVKYCTLNDETVKRQ